MKQLFILLIVIVFLSGCTKKSTDSNPYSNSLQLGTGISTSNYSDLTGVGTTFPAGSTIYFRLESANDQGSSSIMIKINKQDGTLYNSYTYPSLQGYGHIYLSYFTIPDAGNYTATGIMVTGNQTIATISFTIVPTK